MFYRIGESMTEIRVDEIDLNYLTVAYLSCPELEEVAPQLGLAESTVEACREATMRFRSGVEVYDDYTFTELRIINPDHPLEKDDCVALYIKKNIIIVVDVMDYDGSTKEKFMAAIHRYTYPGITPEKVLYAFFEYLIIDDFKYIEDTGNDITELEEEVLKDRVGDDFNLEMLKLKKQLLRMHNYYEQLLDITDAVEDNENNLFDSDNLRYIANMTQKITRLREDTDSLSSSVSHLQDAYASFLDLKLNKIMKLFTVITSIFFPLTVIVGWYGMNFHSMPEFAWKYGYLYVIGLSLTVVTVLFVVGKKRKWF